jgi:hypothetical protein
VAVGSIDAHMLDAELLSPDADFEHIADHSSLRLWRA